MSLLIVCHKLLYKLRRVSQNLSAMGEDPENCKHACKTWTLLTAGNRRSVTSSHRSARCSQSSLTQTGRGLAQSPSLQDHKHAEVYTLMLSLRWLQCGSSVSQESSYAMFVGLEFMTKKAVTGEMRQRYCNRNSNNSMHPPYWRQSVSSHNMNVKNKRRCLSTKYIFIPNKTTEKVLHKEK